MLPSAGKTGVCKILIVPIHASNSLGGRMHGELRVERVTGVQLCVRDGRFRKRVYVQDPLLLRKVSAFQHRLPRMGIWKCPFVGPAYA